MYITNYTTDYLVKKLNNLTLYQNTLVKFHNIAQSQGMVPEMVAHQYTENGKQMDNSMSHNAAQPKIFTFSLTENTFVRSCAVHARHTIGKLRKSTFTWRGNHLRDATGRSTIIT